MHLEFSEFSDSMNPTQVYSDLCTCIKALKRVLQLKGDVSDSVIKSEISAEVLLIINRSSEAHRDDEVVEKASREESVRSRLRAASTVDEINSCIELAEAMEMPFEASLGRRKVLKLFPTNTRE